MQGFEQLFYLFETTPWLFNTTALLIGLCVGSFLNVVAWRLPIIMEREWKKECHDFLELGEPEFDDYTRNLALSVPRSACPKCGHKITAIENIPIISWLFLRGRCSNCGTPISIRYPTVEAITGILTLVVAMQFGVSIETLAAMFFTWCLVALTLIDLDKQLLPDNITLPLLWAGLLLSLWSVFVDPVDSIIGAIFGYMLLWSVFHIFRLVTGKEGMGFGDFKLLAALGAWCGWALLPQIILISSLVGAIVGIAMVAFTSHERRQPIPFGPYLATAGWIAMLWGEEINRAYLDFSAF